MYIQAKFRHVCTIQPHPEFNQRLASKSIINCFNLKTATARFPCCVARNILGESYSGCSHWPHGYVLIQGMHSPKLTISGYKHPHCHSHKWGLWPRLDWAVSCAYQPSCSHVRSSSAGRYQLGQDHDSYLHTVAVFPFAIFPCAVFPGSWYGTAYFFIRDSLPPLGFAISIVASALVKITKMLQNTKNLKLNSLTTTSLNNYLISIPKKNKLE